MGKTTLAKNKEGYGYKYTELAEIHKYLETINARYIQKIERIDGDDYIMTKRCFDGVWENEWLQGCRVVEATLAKIDNPAQQQGSGLTYARRYSLLMAFGLATEDDDAQSLSKAKEVKPMTLEEAKNYKITFGDRHPGETLGEIFEKDKGYLDWVLEWPKARDELKQAINLIYTNNNVKTLTQEEQNEKLLLTAELNELFIKTGIDREKLLVHYKVDSDTKLTIEQLKDAIEKIKKKVA